MSLLATLELPDITFDFPDITGIDFDAIAIKLGLLDPPPPFIPEFTKFREALVTWLKERREEEHSEYAIAKGTGNHRGRTQAELKWLAQNDPRVLKIEKKYK